MNLKRIEDKEKSYTLEHDYKSEEYKGYVLGRIVSLLEDMNMVSGATYISRTDSELIRWCLTSMVHTITGNFISMSDLAKLDTEEGA